MNNLAQWLFEGIGIMPLRGMLSDSGTIRWRVARTGVFYEGGATAVIADLPGLARKDIEVKSRVTAICVMNIVQKTVNSFVECYNISRRMEVQIRGEKDFTIGSYSPMLTHKITCNNPRLKE